MYSIIEAPASPTPLTQRRRESRSPECALKPRSWHTYYIQSFSHIWTNFYTPRPTARAPEYQCLRYINQTNSCPTYWHHIRLLTSPFLYHLHLETSHRPFHIITRLIPQHRNYVCLLWNPRPNSSSYEVLLTSLSGNPRGGNPRGSAPIRGPPLGADVITDVIHHPHALPWQHVLLHIQYTIYIYFSISIQDIIWDMFNIFVQKTSTILIMYHALWCSYTTVANLGYYGQFHTKSSVWPHGRLLFIKLLVRTLPATLYTFYMILIYGPSDPNPHGRFLWSYPVTVSDFVLIWSHNNWGAGLPKPDSGPAPDSLGLGLSPEIHPKVHGRVPWANPFTIRPFPGVPHYYWDVGRPEWVSGSIPTTAPWSRTGWPVGLRTGYQNIRLIPEGHIFHNRNILSLLHGIPFTDRSLSLRVLINPHT